MELLKLAALLLLALLVHACGALAVSSDEEAEDGGEVWMVDDWQASPLLQRGVGARLADLIKRSKAQQFHGLMGRSSGAAQTVRVGRRRNKGEMFVGLMGRRSLDTELEDDWNSGA